MLDLEFKTGANANSGVIVYSTDTKNWIPGAIEVQILDDQGDKWTQGQRQRALRRDLRPRRAEQER